MREEKSSVKKVQWHRLLGTIGALGAIGIAGYAIGHHGIKGTMKGAYHDIQSIVAPGIDERSRSYALAIAKEDGLEGHYAEIFAVVDTICAKSDEDSVAHYLGRTRHLSGSAWEKALGKKAEEENAEGSAGLAAAILSHTREESLGAVSASLGKNLEEARSVRLVDGIYTSLPGSARQEVTGYIVKDGFLRIKRSIATTLDSLLR